MFVSREHGALPAMENRRPGEYSNSWANQGLGILKQALLEKRKSVRKYVQRLDPPPMPESRPVVEPFENPTAR